MSRTNKKSDSLITAYQSNTRQQTNNKPKIVSGWGDTIDRLFGLDHSFLGYEYSTDDVLFRAMSTGFLQALEQGEFGLYEDAKPHSGLEGQLGVYFISHELSDALTIARLWENEDDAVLIIIPSNYFNHMNKECKAAVMAFSEPGFVFKYPFFIEPISLEHILCMIINEKTYDKTKEKLPRLLFNAIKDRLILVKTDNNNKNVRKAIEIHLINMMASNHLTSAIPIESAHYPQK